jgi:tetratricopeptide (TPR) repeat protein
VKEKLPFFALIIGIALLTLWAQQDIMQPLDFLPVSYRLANTPLAYLTYIGMMFWPMHLTVFYPHMGPRISLVQSAAAAGLLLVLTALTLWQARRRPYLIVGWLWYLGTLVPVIGLVQVGRQAHADRYTYIPLIGLFLVLSWGTYDLLGRRRLAQLAASAVAVGLVAVCLKLTWEQLPVWRNNTTLWRHALDVIPSGIAYQGLAKVQEKEGRIDEARRTYEEALRSDPSAVAYNNIGVFLAKHGWTDDALEHFAESLKLYPEQAPAHYNIGRILLRRGKIEEARQHFSEAVRLEPDSADSHYYLGLVLERQGKFRESEAEMIQALKKRPGNANALFHLGVACAGQGRTRDAAQCFAYALRSDPNHVEAQTSLGALLAREGQVTAGQEHLRAALSRDPRNSRAHFNLGLILELDGQRAEARQQFADAVAADPNDAEARRHVETVESQASREQFRILPASVPSR